MVFGNAFADAARGAANQKLTENGALAYRTSGFGALVDLYAVAGALRTRTDAEIESKVAAAYAEDKELTLRMLFWLGDIRGGLGERNTFRVALRYLAEVDPNTIRKNLELIAYYTRWDNIFVLLNGKLRYDVLDLLMKQINEDHKNMILGESISLLAKWMPSANASSQETRLMALDLCQEWNISERSYRKVLSALRAHLKIVETQMSSGKWEGIAYSEIPSVAMNRYRDAFWRHDPEGFKEYLESVKKGEAKINAAALFPYDITEKYLSQGCCSFVREDKVLEAQWNALPNYVEGDHNILVMADTSGSMYGRPLATSVGLAIYFAERNRGAYKNLFMTFSSDADFVELRGVSLAEKLFNASNAHWGHNTNLRLAFQRTLELAIRKQVAPEDMPKALVIISDMEIDAGLGRKYDFLDEQRLLFQRSGYELPEVIFWNVNSRNDTFLDYKGKGIRYATGQSASVFRSVVNNVGLDPVADIVATLRNPRYDLVKV